jgi:hypothetical protein
VAAVVELESQLVESVVTQVPQSDSLVVQVEHQLEAAVVAVVMMLMQVALVERVALDIVLSFILVDEGSHDICETTNCIRGQGEIAHV